MGTLKSLMYTQFIQASIVIRSISKHLGMDSSIRRGLVSTRQKMLTSELSFFQGNLLQILCTNCCTDAKSISLLDFEAVVWELGAIL